MNNKNILITGIAGFIGYSLAKSLLNTGVNIIYTYNSIFDEIVFKDKIQIQQNFAKKKIKHIF